MPQTSCIAKIIFRLSFDELFSKWKKIHQVIDADTTVSLILYLCGIIHYI